MATNHIADSYDKTIADLRLKLEATSAKCEDIRNLRVKEDDLKVRLKEVRVALQAAVDELVSDTEPTLFDSENGEEDSE